MKKIEELNEDLRRTKIENGDVKVKEESLATKNKELKEANKELKHKLKQIVNDIESSNKFVRKDKENTSPHQYIEITQNVIEFRSPKAQLPKTMKKNQTQTKVVPSPHKKIATAFKDIITTLLK